MLFAKLLLAGTFYLLSGIHVFWMLGGKWGADQVIPTSKDGVPLFQPGRFATAFVAIGLALFGTYYLNSAQWVPIPWHPTMDRIGSWAIPTIFTLRALGDFKYIGAFKRVKNTPFGEMDSKFFSPLCLIISIIGFYLLINQTHL